MDTVLERENITDTRYREILDKEVHHNHIIVINGDGRISWKRNEEVGSLLENMGFNKVLALLRLLGCNQNSEMYRKLHRDAGVLLATYWDTFYNDTYNPIAHEYIPKEI